MSGHNKWKQIKEKKGKTDAMKSRVFAKMANLISAEARKSGGKDSPELKALIDRAKSANMPNDNIERAIKRATDAGAKEMESVRYEAYGPGGVAIIIEALTDSRNRTSAEIKHLLSLSGGSLTSPGAVVWAFERKNMEWSPTSSISLSDDDLSALDNLVDALENQNDVQEVFTNAE